MTSFKSDPALSLQVHVPRADLNRIVAHTEEDLTWATVVMDTPQRTPRRISKRVLMRWEALVYRARMAAALRGAGEHQALGGASNTTVPETLRSQRANINAILETADELGKQDHEVARICTRKFISLLCSELKSAYWENRELKWLKFLDPNFSLTTKFLKLGYASNLYRNLSAKPHTGCYAKCICEFRLSSEWIIFTFFYPAQA